MSRDILVLAPLADETALRLQPALQALGHSPKQVDLGQFPAALTIHVDERGAFIDGQKLDDFAAAYVRRGEYMSPVPAWLPDKARWSALRTTYIDELRLHQETRSVHSSILRLLGERLPVVSPAWLWRMARLLPWMMRSLEDAGLPVAPFVCGNDLQRIALFVDEHQECCAARRLSSDLDAEVRCDFAFLKQHHLDFDAFPWLVRRQMDLRREEAATFAHGPVIASTTNVEVSRLAEQARTALGAPLALVSFELDKSGAPWIVGFDPEPDLAAFGDRVGQDAVAPLAALLARLAEEGRPLGRPEPQTHIVDSSATSSLPITIGLSGQIGDAEVAAVRAALEQRGARVLPIELPLFPTRRALHEARGGGLIGQTSLEQLHAVYHRSAGFGSPLPDSEASVPTQAEWEALYEAYARHTRDDAECFLFKYAVLEILACRVAVLNPAASQEVHRNKIWQLFGLARAGLPVPPTVAGNDLHACQRFVDEMGGENKVVCKPLAGIFKTQLLSELGLVRALGNGPVILQRYIEGPTIRAYVVDGQLIGAGRMIQREKVVDSSIGQIGVEPFELPASAAAQGARAARHLGLAWTGMDFMREDATGEFFILECNASAMFANFSWQTGADVPGALAELLLRKATQGRSTLNMLDL
ncbi:MAG: hypothetical protein MUC50_22375 [Myxococcota bacterium]|jgi:glutathione synthase/RimK-type ligase-like ATP-grasp enzyme|nr:hypothetical protein [Myxococcota bacterium]